MNEQPQPHNLQPDTSKGDEQLYQSKSAQSAFAGYDLTPGAALPTPASVGFTPTDPPLPSALPGGGGLGGPATASGPGPTSPLSAADPADTPQISWEALEYVHHAKNTTWFAVFGAVVLALLVLAYFTQAWTFVILVIVMAVAMAIFALRPPRTLHYSLTHTGLQVEQAFYNYNDFRAFGILADETSYSIVLIPTRRFMPGVNIYFAEANGEKIVDILGARLPMEELKFDLVDRLMRRMRF